MSLPSQKWLRRAGGALVLGSVALGVWQGRLAWQRARAPLVDRIRSAVPSAASSFQFRGAGFTRSADGHFTSDTSAPAKEVQDKMIAVTAPDTAGGSFQVGAMGTKRRATLRLVGAEARHIELENGAAVYRRAYAGVDVVAVRDPSRFEILYVVDDPARAPSLALEVGVGAKGKIKEEPRSGVAVVVDEKGAAVLRIEPPLAIDADGVRRPGSYVVSDDKIQIALNWDGLRGPVVVDPGVYLPMWFITSDTRVPGSTVYDADRLSRETHMTFDSKRGKAVLVRPIRSQQQEDQVMLFGDANGFEAYHQDVSSTPRVGTNGVVEPMDVQREWARGYLLASETWEWAQGQWSLSQDITLPGLIDPTLAYDPIRGVTVLYGGAPPSFGCVPGRAYGVGTSMFCGNAGELGITYEYDGTSWVARRILSPPDPRLRASMTWDSARGRVLLFGGREIWTDAGLRLTMSPYDRPFPENLAKGLLNDTWAYDGSSWERLPTANPPPPVEGATLLYDDARKRAVLVGGHRDDDPDGKGDRLSIWEFDGTDWREAIHPGDPGLPNSIRTRRSPGAFWNPDHARITIVGGIVDKGDGCTLSDAEVSDLVTSTQNDPTGRETLVELGCLGGYVHDAWEWDGTSLTQVTQVAFGGYVGSQPVFRQVATNGQGAGGGSSPEAGTPTLPADAGVVSTPLWAWRNDPRANHFELRTGLERSYLPGSPGGFNAAPPTDGGTALPPQPAPSQTMVSPLFASRIKPEVIFDPARSRALLFTPDDAGILETDGTTWSDRNPPSSPFSQGTNDFYASTFDTGQHRIVLFDPRTAATWFYTDTAGWTRATPGSSPPVWNVNPAFRLLRDIKPDRTRIGASIYRTQGPPRGNEMDVFDDVARKLPRMTFDRTRQRVVMIYAGATWEFDGASWNSQPLPASFTACDAAVSLSYDGQRARTVAFGCRIPAETWEWNGLAWAGPGPSPYQTIFERDTGIFAPLGGPFQTASEQWSGTLQLTWSHPNAAFESTASGGVSMIDADGTMRTWNGTTWSAGPKMPQGPYCVSSWAWGYADGNKLSGSVFDTGPPFPMRHDQFLGMDFLPMCFFPPVVEAAAQSKTLAFRDGVRGLLELRKDPALPQATQWVPTPLGRIISSDFANLVIHLPGNWANDTRDPVHSYPFELMSPEHVYMVGRSDPASRIVPSLPGPLSPSDANLLVDRLIQNLWWPYQLVTDATNQDVRLVTNRGIVWKVGGEPAGKLGDPCNDGSECGEGTCNAVEKICCNHDLCALPDANFGMVCTTCRGTHPGICEVVANGAPEPNGYCGTGECAGVCAQAFATPQPVPLGFSGHAACSFDANRPCGPASTCALATLRAGGHCTPGGCEPSSAVPTLCPNGLTCADDTSCKTHCTASSDCLPPFNSCDQASGTCAVDNPPSCVAGALLPAVHCLATDPNCPSTPTPLGHCADGLGCADSTTCRSTCTTRSQCASRFEECSADGLRCVPDQVSQVAGLHGVQPVNWVPPARRSQAEISAQLKAAGVPSDNQGRFMLPTGDLAGVTLVYDPSLKTPLTGVKACLQQIELCMGVNSQSQIDSCVASSSRCASGTPWTGDPAGEDCCPTACLVSYFDNRSTMNEITALREFLKSDCYPGLSSYLSSGDTP
jgi:hypothetical protein